ncbi:MAG TPA: hypothetical protein VHB27_05475 [Rhodopila sp.]|nr:hypothetical protein [Rhodopila sp.]HVY14655.1 hypothetical protein [Rhodopila sp.]
MDGIKALTVDTGGTVPDWRTGTGRALHRAGGRHGPDLDRPGIATG